MAHPREESGRGDNRDHGLTFLVGQALCRIEEKLEKLERTAAGVGAKLDTLLEGSGVDLTPEEKAAFEERLQRLEGLGTPATPNPTE